MPRILGDLVPFEEYPRLLRIKVQEIRTRADEGEDTKELLREIEELQKEIQSVLKKEMEEEQSSIHSTPRQVVPAAGSQKEPLIDPNEVESLPHCVDRHTDKQCPTASTVSIDTQTNVDRHLSEEDEWSEDESYDDESSDGEFDAKNFEKLLCEAYMEYHGISSATEIQVHIDRLQSEQYSLQPTECVKQSENEVFTDEELHQFILEGIEEENVRKMGAQPFTEAAKEIPLPETKGTYDELNIIHNTNIVCSKEPLLEIPTEEATSLHAENLSTRFDLIDEIKSGMNNLDYITEDRISTFEESTCLSKEIYLENDLNVDKILEEVENSKVKVESEIENTMFYEVKGDEIEYLIDPPKPEIDFVFSPDLFYPHMLQPHLERVKIGLEYVASAYYNCLLAMLWNFVCLVVCLFACNDRRRTKGALAQPFDSCD